MILKVKEVANEVGVEKLPTTFLADGGIPTLLATPPADASGRDRHSGNTSRYDRYQPRRNEYEANRNLPFRIIGTASLPNTAHLTRTKLREAHNIDNIIGVKSRCA